jgi:hypothetical protein
VPKRPLQLRELLKKIKPYGIEVLQKRGKGSEIILLKPTAPGSRQGPQYPLKNHGASAEIYIPVIIALLRRFDIDPNDFWD